MISVHVKHDNAKLIFHKTKISQSYQGSRKKLGCHYGLLYRIDTK